MILQTDDFSCGPCAIVNVLKAMGRVVDEQTVAALAGTTFKRGTDECQVIAALNGLGYVATPLPQKTLYWHVVHYVMRGTGVIVYDPHQDHWLAVVGACGYRVVIFDSLVGVRVLTESTFGSLAEPDMYAVGVHAP